MAIVNVNHFLKEVESTDLKIDAISSSELYKDATFFKPDVLNCIKRFESNVKVSSRSGDGLVLSDFKLLDDTEIDSIRKKSNKYKYLHYGVILVGIKAMLPNFRGMEGRVIVYDGACLDPERGHICSYLFKFESDCCYFGLRPEHCLSTTDANLAKRFRFRVDFDCPQYEQDTELFALDIGVAYRCVNSARFLETKTGDSGWASQAISGCEALKFNEEIKMAILARKSPLLLEEVRQMCILKRECLGVTKSEGHALSLQKGDQTQGHRKRRGFESLSARIEMIGKNEFGRRASTSEAPPGRSVSVEDPHGSGKGTFDGSSP
uniref:Movement protein n=1 Tax=Capillovirus mali TaxID=28347 RepID=A0A8F9WIW4_9VIRU|nr:movement protein [Apple stem grooving virus]